MEQLLWLYAQPHDPLFPVVCYDERPCFLIGERVTPLSLQSGQVAKEHYAYTKHGSCALLAAIEPLTGERIAAVYERRTGKEYMLFCQQIAAHYPDATKIRLVQDNLNTHTFASFYNHLPAQEAFALSQRFEFWFTPKSASWLNMIEIEFSALAQQCLKRRIPTIEQLRTELLACIADRHEKRILIRWQFTTLDARYKLSRHYERVNPDNKKTITT